MSKSSFEPDRGGEARRCEETHGVGECVLDDEHALGVAGNEFRAEDFASLVIRIVLGRGRDPL